MSDPSTDPSRMAAEELIGLLERLMRALNEADAREREFDTGMLLTRAETHTLQAIGREPGLNLTRLATVTAVTKGAASQMVSRLVGKGLVRKSRSRDSAREVVLDLTARGWRGFHAHERFHLEVFQAVREYYGGDVVRRARGASRVVQDLLGIVQVFVTRLGAG